MNMFKLCLRVFAFGNAPTHCNAKQTDRLRYIITQHDSETSPEHWNMRARTMLCTNRTFAASSVVGMFCDDISPHVCIRSGSVCVADLVLSSSISERNPRTECSHTRELFFCSEARAAQSPLIAPCASFPLRKNAARRGRWLDTHTRTHRHNLFAIIFDLPVTVMTAGLQIYAFSAPASASSSTITQQSPRVTEPYAHARTQQNHVQRTRTRAFDQQAFVGRG